jgi:hypothetical protein
MTTLLSRGMVPGVVMLVGVLAVELAVGRRLWPDSYLGLAARSLVSLPIALAVAAAAFPRDEWAALRQLLPIGSPRAKDPQPL